MAATLPITLLAALLIISRGTEKSAKENGARLESLKPDGTLIRFHMTFECCMQHPYAFNVTAIIP
jgi:hypothetical protein